MGLGLRDMRNVKIATMSKNVCRYMNFDAEFWVKIMRAKYGPSRRWSDNIPPNCTWLYRLFCNTTKLMKPHT